MTKLQSHDAIETSKTESTALVNDEIQGTGTLLIADHTCIYSALSFYDPLLHSYIRFNLIEKKREVKEEKRERIKSLTFYFSGERTQQDLESD